MIAKTTLQFLKQLKANNSKAWFDDHREVYTIAKSNVADLATALILQIAKFDASVAHLEAKNCLFRINRDVRFSANKAPYKSNMSVYICAQGKGGNYAGYYLHIEPGASFAAAGVWMPMAPELKKIRQEIDYNLSVFQKAVESKNFKSTFEKLNDGEAEKLSRPPKGYTADNPAIEYLKLKSFIASTPISDLQLQQAELYKTAATIFKAASPLVLFINETLSHTE